MAESVEKPEVKKPRQYNKKPKPEVAEEVVVEKPKRVYKKRKVPVDVVEVAEKPKRSYKKKPKVDLEKEEDIPIPKKKPRSQTKNTVMRNLEKALMEVAKHELAMDKLKT